MPPSASSDRPAVPAFRDRKASVETGRHHPHQAKGAGGDGQPSSLDTAEAVALEQGRCGDGGVQGGRIVGSTNRLGEVPQDRPVSPADIHHTMFQVLGINPHVSFLNHSGRPVPALEPGAVIQELM